ncbi:TIGR03016 family PEP-CTERM system-associated outer membrane protein [Massilia sp. LC238]|uniref:TIGR03016 family PEP-CTERM system-associated outer membrane protein n=1 Tax=Massilia sp. LC238 TaxID=1502852 RepID=UPI000A4532D6|nr:TIGR03016 family PEP-CTERM system-associated outer membrane protein [Massilia sp. LC238]
MITTMGELRAGVARMPRLAPLAIAAMLLASECRADWRVVPALTLTERYTDNFYQEGKDLKRSQFISELTPSLSFLKTGPRLVLNGTAQWRHFDYRDDDLRDTLDHSFEYAVSGRGTLAKDFLYVDASASARPNNVSVFGPRVEDAPYLSANQAKVKTWRVSPYLEHRYGRTATLAMRYARDRVEGGRGARGFGNSSSDSVSASLASGPAFNQVGWGLTHVRQDLDDTYNGETSSESTTANVRYALTRRFALTATVGYDNYQFVGLGNDTAGRNWSVGFNWTPSQRTNLSAALGRHFYGQTGSFSLLHRSRRTSWNLAYNDGVTTAREQFLLPSTIDTTELLDRLFAASITDPVARQQAVAAYIRDTGLPPSISENVNFLSNRYFRQKQLLGSMAFKMARTSGVLSLSSSERIALSNEQSDSVLLGTQVGGRNDNVRQHDATANLNYRLSPRTSALAVVGWGRSRSLTTDVVDTRRDFRLGLTHQLSREVRAAVDLNRRFGTYGRLGRSSGPFYENSISASLSAQF